MMDYLMPVRRWSTFFPTNTFRAGRMWIAFVHDLDPNGHGVNGNNGHSIPE